MERTPAGDDVVYQGSEGMVWDDGGNGKRGWGGHSRHAIQTASIHPDDGLADESSAAQATEPWDGTPQINPVCFPCSPTEPRIDDGSRLSIV